MYIGRPQKTGPYITLDDISSQFNGVDVTFNLTTGGSPFIADNPYTVFLSLNGVIQEPVSAFTIVGSQITFANPPLANANFFATVLGSTFNREIRNATSLASGVNITAGDISCNSLSSSGTVSATSFVGDGSQLSGIDATSLIDQNGTVRAQANPDGLVVTGILTATQFDGVDVTALRDSAGGNVIVQANPGGAVVTGILTGSSASFSGDVNIGGTLTYEDVTNIDSVGLITARSGIHVGTGVTFTEDLVVDGDARITGILTIGTGTVSIDGNNNSVNIGAGVTLHTITSSFNQLEVTGFSTFYSGIFAIDQYLGFGNPGSFGTGELRIRKRTNTQGIIQNQTGDFIIDNQVDSTSNYIRLQGRNTAIEGRYGGQTIAKFSDGGSVELNHNGSKKFETTNNGVTITGGISATGGTNAIGIQSGGLNISTGIITALNFVGAGNTFSVNGSTVDISIAAGSDLVIVDGGDFNSSSSTAGASSEINGGEFT